MKARVEKLVFTVLAACLMLGASVASAEVVVSTESASDGEQTTVVEAQATVVKIDYVGRNVTLEAVDGRTFTVHAPESLGPLDNIHGGDTLRAVYVEAIAGEVREPTEAELKMPWVKLSKAQMGEFEGQPVAADTFGVRAVCTIEGMNRLLGTATVTDSKGRVHILTEVKPSMMEGVTLGQTVVIDYLQAFALTLERISP